MYKLIVSVGLFSMSVVCFAYSPAIPPECKYYTSDDKLNELPAPRDLKKILGSDRGLKACLYHDGEWRYNITSPIQSVFGVSFFYEKSIYLWKASHSSAWESTPLNGKGVDERSLHMKLESQEETFSDEDFVEVSDISVGTFKAIMTEWEKISNSNKLLNLHFSPLPEFKSARNVVSSFMKSMQSKEKPRITRIVPAGMDRNQGPSISIDVDKKWIFDVDIIDGELKFLNIHVIGEGEVYQLLEPLQK